MDIDSLNPYEKYLLAWFVRPLRPGDSFARNWPLHLTLVPWFWPRDPEKIFRAITAITQGQPTIEIICAEVGFLAGGRIKVRLVERSEGLEQWHMTLVQTISELSIPMMDKFTGKQYLPHITFRGADTPPLGAHLYVDHLAIVKALPDRVRVVRSVIKLN
jgi:hypothetical protein